MDNFENIRSQVSEYLKENEEFLVGRLDVYKATRNLGFHKSIKEEYGVENDEIFIKKRTINKDELNIIIEKANNDIEAYEYCVRLASEFVCESEELSNFTVKIATGEIVKPTAKRGKNPGNNYARNFTILIAVQKCKETGMPVYSNGNNTKLTACNLVKEVLANDLNIHSINVAKIWQNSHLT
jgi:hypothetical protein